MVSAGLVQQGGSPEYPGPSGLGLPCLLPVAGSPTFALQGFWDSWVVSWAQQQKQRPRGSLEDAFSRCSGALSRSKGTALPPFSKKSAVEAGCREEEAAARTVLEPSGSPAVLAAEGGVVCRVSPPPLSKSPLSAARAIDH